MDQRHHSNQGLRTKPDLAHSWRVIVGCDSGAVSVQKMATALQSTITLGRRQSLKMVIGIARSETELCLTDGMTQVDAVKAVERLSSGGFQARCEATEHSPPMPVAVAPTLTGILLFRSSDSPDRGPG